MIEERLFQQLLSAVVQAIHQQDWDALIIANRRLTAILAEQALSALHRQQLHDLYHDGLAECQLKADALWQKMQKTLNDREAMAAYACFGDAESFSV